jgi:hypothetical protein
LKVPILKSYSAFTDGFFDGWLRHDALRRAALGADRIWFSRTAAVVPADRAAFEAFVHRATTDGAAPIVVHPAAGSPQPAPGTTTSMEAAPPATRIAARLEDYTPRRLRLTVTAASDGWLLVTDRWAPGWSVRVNGEAAPLWRSSFLFRAVRVPAGVARVEFTYRPAGYPLLPVLSWGTLIAVLVQAIVLWSRGTARVSRERARAR